MKQTEQLRADGALSEGRVLDHSNRILNLLRECNVALRWVMLHAASLSRGGAESNRRCKAVRDQVRERIGEYMASSIDLCFLTVFIVKMRL